MFTNEEVQALTTYIRELEFEVAYHRDRATVLAEEIERLTKLRLSGPVRPTLSHEEYEAKWGEKERAYLASLNTNTVSDDKSPL